MPNPTATPATGPASYGHRLPGSEGGGNWWEYVGTFDTEYVHAVNAKPTDEYLGLLCQSMADAGVAVLFDGVSRRLIGSVAKLSRESLAAIKRHGEDLVQYLLRTGQLAPAPRAPERPRPGALLVWDSMDPDRGAGDGWGVCMAEELDSKPWVRWKYKNSKRWYAASGDTWEE